MQFYGLRGIIYRFLSSYLSGRKRFVNVSSFQSDCANIDIGVPQGSVLGPLLFNLFINDIVDIDDSKKILFADDTVFYVSDVTLELCILKLKKLIEKLSIWLDCNKLSPNIKKTKLMLITSKHVITNPDIYFKN